jgi:peptidoglycan/LPS O-acetylase OafA/YrhL
LPHSLSLAVELVTALAISALSWRYLEQPLAAWKQKRYPMEKSIVTAGKP